MQFKFVRYLMSIDKIDSAGRYHIEGPTIHEVVLVFTTYVMCFDLLWYDFFNLYVSFNIITFPSIITFLSIITLLIFFHLLIWILIVLYLMIQDHQDKPQRC